MGIVLAPTVRAAPAPPPPAATEHPLSRNLHGGILISSISQVFDPTHEWFLWSRVAHWNLFQPQQIWGPTLRTARMNQWREVSDTNPLCLLVIHQRPFHSWPIARMVAEDQNAAITDYMHSVERTKGVVYIDRNLDEAQVNSTRASSSNNPANQTGVLVLLTDQDLRIYAAKVMHDTIIGAGSGDLSGRGQPGQDMSDVMGPFHDGTPVIQPKFGNRLQIPYKSGTILSIISSEPDAPFEPQIIKLSIDVALATNGTPLPEDNSFEEVDENENNMMVPPTGLIGISGRQILGYKADGPDSQLYLKRYNNTQNTTQNFTPVAGWLFNINEQNNGSSAVDWDADGVTEDIYAGSILFTAAWEDYRDRISSLIDATVGSGGSGLGGNIAQGVVSKAIDGWPSPHARTGSDDYPMAEGFSPFAFEIEPFDPLTTHDYDISSADVTKGMGLLYWAASHTRANPGAGNWIADKARGFYPEFIIWGLDYNMGGKPERAHALLAWYLALAKSVPDTNFAGKQGEASGTDQPILFDEAYLDFNTNWVTPAPIGTYDEGGGGNGNNGHPVGLFTFATPDFGERGYFRRYGDFGVAFSMADPPPAYVTYRPSWQAGGFTPRATLDEMTATDFTALFTSGLLQAGETIFHIDPTTYINQLWTAELQNHPNPVTAAKWASFSVGPFQAHPDDSDNNPTATFKLSDHPGFLHDAGINTGLQHDMGTSLFVAPVEANWFTIVPPP